MDVPRVTHVDVARRQKSTKNVTHSLSRPSPHKKIGRALLNPNALFQSPGSLLRAPALKTISLTTERKIPIWFYLRPNPGLKMPDLSWRHHALIQALLSRGPLKEDKFHSIFNAVTRKDPGSHQQLFNDCLLTINKELAFVQFELRGCRNQYDGEVYYGVVNNVADEQSKLGTKYSVPQVAFYKAVVEAIVHDTMAQGSISNIEALNIRLERQVQMANGSQSQGGPSNVPPAFKNFSISQKEKTLDELVRDSWLCSTSDGNIGLGVRSFLDLRSWFRNNDVPSCDICNEAGVKAELCQNEGCMVRIHSYCVKKKFSQRRVERVCPSCGTQWRTPMSKRELVEEEENEELSEPPIQTQAASSSGNAMKKRRRSCKHEPMDTVGASSSGAGAHERRTTRSSARQR